jgi:hypothetical protein
MRCESGRKAEPEHLETRVWGGVGTGPNSRTEQNRVARGVMYSSWPGAAGLPNQFRPFDLSRPFWLYPFVAPPLISDGIRASSTVYNHATRTTWPLGSCSCDGMTTLPLTTVVSQCFASQLSGQLW